MPKSTEIVLQFPIPHLVFGLFLSPLYSWQKEVSFFPKSILKSIKKTRTSSIWVFIIFTFFLQPHSIPYAFILFPEREWSQLHIYILLDSIILPLSELFSTYTVDHNAESMHKKTTLPPQSSLETPTSPSSKRKLSSAEDLCIRTCIIQNTSFCQLYCEVKRNWISLY